MRTIVVGGGVVGVTTAYYLAKEGHDVTVIDKSNNVGQEATAVNAGLIAPGHCFAWASPAAPKMLLKSLLGEKTAIRVKPSLSPRFLWWGMQFMRECTAERAKTNTLAKLGLSVYSQELLYQIEAEENIDYDGIKKGLVYTYRDENEMKLGIVKAKILSDAGQTINSITSDELAKLDPAFGASSIRFAGAIYAPNDASGNSEKFSVQLMERCKALGVKFEFGVEAKKFTQKNGKITSVVTNQGEMEADNFVLAMGVMSPFLSRTIGQDLPVYPAKGFSVTIDITNKDAAPTIGGVDEKTLVAWSRFNDKLRISSTAQFSGYDRSHTRADFDNIINTASALWPEAADWSKPNMTAGLRPMTPDGTPIIGKGDKHSNLFYNTGHGHMGWTMSCGSSKMLTDIMHGRTPALPTEPFKVRSIRK